MDLAKEQIPENKLIPNILSVVLTLPGFWIIYQLLPKAYLNYSEGRPVLTGLAGEFQNYRNSFYLVYVLLLLIVGMYVRLCRMSKKDFKKPLIVQKALTGAVCGIILITLSLSLVSFIIEVLAGVKSFFGIS